MFYVNPWYADAMQTGARVAGDGIELSLIGRPQDWPQEETIITPFGDVTMLTEPADEMTAMRFQAAQTFPVTLRYGSSTETTSSTETVSIAHDALCSAS